MTLANTVQTIINVFLWNGKKTRIKISTLQQEEGRISCAQYTVILSCCAFSCNDTLVAGWVHSNRTTWLGEQIKVPILLSEWMLLRPEDSGNLTSNNNKYAYNTFMET